MPVCPNCGAPRSGRYCEIDGHDFEAAEQAGGPHAGGPQAGGPQAGGGAHTVEMSVGHRPASSGAGGWATPLVPPPRPGSGASGTAPSPRLTAVINADEDYHTSVIALEGPDSAALAFPPYCPERRVPLSGAQVRIGRRSAARGTFPEIDLGVLPEDPGVSHLHAVLLAQPDGTWALVDPGSTNGTTVNGGSEPVPVNVPVPVGAGDRIHVGAWTTITLSPAEGPP